MRELDKQKAMERTSTAVGFGQCTCPSPCVTVNCGGGGSKPRPPQKCVSETNTVSGKLKDLYEE